MNLGWSGETWEELKEDREGIESMQIQSVLMYESIKNNFKKFKGKKLDGLPQKGVAEVINAIYSHILKCAL